MIFLFGERRASYDSNRNPVYARTRTFFIVGVLLCCLSCRQQDERHDAAPGGVRTFAAKGVVKEIKPDGQTAVIRHDAISNYMDAMTMPFHAKSTNDLHGIRAGDVVTFRLSVSEEKSWIDQVTRVGTAPSTVSTNTSEQVTNTAPPKANIIEGLASFTFTNEFSQPVDFAKFKGQAVGLTFFFTRCPIPEYCPRLSKNFAAATQKLKQMPNAPTNWHFFSISFDTKNDTPAVLRTYAKSYAYDSNHWTFLTSSPETIEEIARRFNFSYRQEGGLFTHNFLTLVLNANGYWSAAWPIGGDTSDNLVQEIVKAANPQK